MWFKKKDSDDALLKELLKMMEYTTKELTTHIETLERVGVVQSEITRRLDHIESFLDQMYGSDEEEDRIIN